MNQIKPHSMSLWRHFYDRERTAEELTESMIEWQEKWTWDFMKINPAACYHVLDWGAEYEFSRDPLQEQKLIRPVVESPADVSRIQKLDIQKGALGDQLQAIKNLRSHFGKKFPMVETVFAPIEIAHRLMRSREDLSRLRKEDPAAMHRLLKTIMEVFQEFTVAAIEAGADGIFFATKWANEDQMSWPEYEEFGKRYELPILQTLAKKDALLILHVCGARTYLSKMLDYPVSYISYDFFAEKALDPVQVAASEKFVLGGIDPDHLQDVDRVVQYKRIPNWIAAPSCVIPVTARDEEIRNLVSQLRPQLQQ